MAYKVKAKDENSSDEDNNGDGPDDLVVEKEYDNTQEKDFEFDLFHPDLNLLLQLIHQDFSMITKPGSFISQ